MNDIIINLNPCSECGKSAAMHSRIDEDGDMMYSVRCYSCENQTNEWLYPNNAVEEWNQKNPTIVRKMQKERLVELLNSLLRESWHYETSGARNNYIAECLLKKGVIVPPVQVGTRVYVVPHNSSAIYRVDVCNITENENGSWTINQRQYPEGVFEVKKAEFGKNVFLTLEEADAAMKEAKK